MSLVITGFDNVKRKREGGEEGRLATEVKFIMREERFLYFYTHIYIKKELTQGGAGEGMREK